MPKTLFSILVVAFVFSTNPAGAAELCGRLQGECLDGAESCAHYIRNSSGLHAIAATSAEVELDLSADADKDVCAAGRFVRSGFEASRVRLSLAEEENAELDSLVTEDALCLHNVECGHGYHHKVSPQGCMRCEKNK